MEAGLSEQAEKKLREIQGSYPDPKSAVMAALYIAQEELGCIGDEAINWVAQRTGIAPVHVMELASFYGMYHSAPRGRYHFQLCRGLCCALRGANALTVYIKQRFALEAGQVSSNGLWSFEEVECLGSCGTAPACLINDHCFENLSVEKLGQIIERIEAEEPDLSFSTVYDSLGDGLKDYPKSELTKVRKAQ